LVNNSISTDLRLLVGNDGVSIEPDDLACHTNDSYGRYAPTKDGLHRGTPPRVVVNPTHVDQVLAVACYSSERGIPLIPWGGGTGVAGGALAVDGSIVMDLKKLNRIDAVDVENRTATVGSGVILEQVAQVLEGQGLILGHDPWSLPIATVGGAVATNGVGYLAGKYGSMGDQVVGLEVVLPYGEVLSPQQVSKTAGPSLNSLFTGSEGTIGIITKVVLQVYPTPEVRSLHAIRFSGFEDGFNAVQEMHSMNLRPAMIDFAEEFSDGILSGKGRSETILYLSFEGFVEQVSAECGRGLRICSRNGGEELNREVANHFWNHRHDSGYRYKREILEKSVNCRPSYVRSSIDYLHVAIPVSEVLSYRRFCQDFFQKNGIFVKEWSLWGRPEFFSFLVTASCLQDDDRLLALQPLVDHVLMAAQDLGGTMEYCHGVGVKRSHLMERDRGSDLEILRKIKAAVDPNSILNPGKLGLD